MCECLSLFSEATRAWFKHAFVAPTDVQQAAWPAICSGENVLAVAPTGSGKTLSAFLASIDRLMTRQGRIRGGVSVLYVSPLKALAVDVAKNLKEPLAGISGEYEAKGVPAPSVTVATRSGDTSPKERRAIVAHPPDILVTTPESLYLMLTSQARRILTAVDTVIIDEIHSLAGAKRGAHLSLSLERLDLLTERPAQRIGLSATVNPVSEAARFLGGSHPVTIIDPSSRPTMDLRVIEPLADMHDLQSGSLPRRAGGADASSMPAISGVSPAMQRLAERRGLGRHMPPGNDVGQCSASDSSWNVSRRSHAPSRRKVSPSSSGTVDDRSAGSIWPVVERSVLEEILAHRTTLVFVNSRGLAERLTARLNDLYAQVRGTLTTKTSPEGREGFAEHYDAVVGSTTMLVQSHASDDVIAMAHHGSVSKERRKQIEERLKQGVLRCVVATSSLELGIDMGSVDLVIQIAPPLSVASGLQRVGRADHKVGGVSHAVIYPLTREQIIGSAACIESMIRGDIEPLHVPCDPLDVLAQQTVAAAAMDDLKPDRWYETVRRAAPFQRLSRDMFDAVMGMMTGAYNTEEFSAFRPPLAWNHDDDIISARPGAQRLAVTSGGTIPDRGLYTVVIPEADAGKGQRRVGELDEEMVYESRVGDVITLGTSTWQIQEITRDRVVVTPAPGRTARLPFWHGDGNGRDYGFGLAQGRLIRDAVAGLSSAVDDRHDVTVADSSDAARRSGFASAKDQAVGNGPVNAYEAPQHAKPRFVPRIMNRLHHDGLDDNAIDNLACLLAEQRSTTGIVPDDLNLVVERCPDEEGDWRIIVHSPFGRRVHEPWAMAINGRLKQRYGFDGHIYAADDGIVIRLPDTETTIPIRDVILFDPDTLQRLIEAQVGESVLFAAKFRECAARSLFLPRTEPGKRVPLWQQRLRAAQLLNAARMRKNFPLLLETARECLRDVYDLPALRHIMSALNAGTIKLHDVRTSTPSPFAEQLLFGFVGAVMYQYDVPQAERSAQLLSMDPQVLERLIGTTDLSEVLDPQSIAEVEQQLASRTYWNELAEHDVIGRVTRYAKTHGPFTAEQMIGDLHIDAEEAVHALDRLAAQGDLISGSFLQGGKAVQWLHRDVFRRIRSRSLAKARAAIKPVAQDVYQAFVLDRQGIGPVGGERYRDEDGLMDVIEQLEGISLPIEVWEDGVFPARVSGYAPSMLDELISNGDVIWVGSKTDSTKANESGRISFYASDSPLMPPMPKHEQSDDDEMATLPETILNVLASGGAYRADQLSGKVRERWQEAFPNVDDLTGEIRPRAWSEHQFEDALWSLVWLGLVTNSSMTPVRALTAGSRKPRASAANSRRRLRVQPAIPAHMGGLWSLIGGNYAKPAWSPEQRAIARVETLLDRYGVIAQPLVDKDDVPGGFSALYPVLKRMEEAGSLVRGLFVQGFGAAQFADKNTVNALRDAGREHNRSTVAIDTTDPANLTGSVVEWPDLASDTGDKPSKPVRRSGTIVVLEQGRPVLYAAPRSRHIVAFDRDESVLRPACAELAFVLRRRIDATIRSGGVVFADFNGEPLTQRSEASRLLHVAGFTPCPQGMKLYR